MPELLEAAAFAPVFGTRRWSSVHNPDVAVLDLAVGQQRLAGLPLIGGIRSHNPRPPILGCGLLESTVQLRDK